MARSPEPTQKLEKKNSGTVKVVGSQGGVIVTGQGPQVGFPAAGVDDGPLGRFSQGRQKSHQREVQMAEGSAEDNTCRWFGSVPPLTG